MAGSGKDLESKGYKRDPNTGLIDESVYKHLEGALFPDNVELELTYPTTHKTIRILSGQLPTPFLLNTQPGPSIAITEEVKEIPKHWILPEKWKDIPGAPGCSGEAEGLCRNQKAIIRKCHLYGLSNRPSAQQQIAMKQKGITYPLLSDAQLTLARRLGLPISTVKRNDGSDYTYIERVSLFVGTDNKIKKVFCNITDPKEFATQVLGYIAPLKYIDLKTTAPRRRLDDFDLDDMGNKTSDPLSSSTYLQRSQPAAPLRAQNNLNGKSKADAPPIIGPMLQKKSKPR